jgi:hypothetical protein
MYDMRKLSKINLLFFLFSMGLSPMVHTQILDTVSTPRELWQRCQKTLPKPEISITRDEIVESYTNPTIKLRRIELSFCSMEFEGKKWIHPCVVFLPIDPKYYMVTGRRGKIIIVAHSGGDESEPFNLNYGDPIATLTGYPTMVFQNPGEGREGDFRFMIERERGKLVQNPIDHNYFRMAIPYLEALDIMADIMKIKRNEIRAIIGGHSKRATGAYNAAAIDSTRIAGVVYMGNESLWGITEGYPSVCPAKIKEYVKARVLYIGASNEFYRPEKYEYHMFNINKIQEMMRGTWTIEYVPNYIHFAMSEKHFLDWRMWIAHVFENRPITRITDFTYQKMENGTRFRAHIQSENKIIQVKLWHVFTRDTPPFWSDLFWRPSLMTKQNDGFYEGFVSGKLPDAWLVEVKDIANGVPGYISSLPQDITGKKDPNE